MVRYQETVFTYLAFSFREPQLGSFKALRSLSLKERHSDSNSIWLHGT